MSINKIGGSKIEFIKKLSSVCADLNIKLVLETESELQNQYKISRDDKESTIRVYVKRDGIKLDTSVGKDKELNMEIEELINSTLNKTRHSNFSYKDIDESQFYEIYRLFEELASGDVVLNQRENNDPNKSHFFEIKNQITKECIRISRFKNGTVTIDGIVWILWEDVCQIIERNNDSITVNNIIKRLLVQDEDEIEEEDFTEEEQAVKELISLEVYNFLEAHFKDYLISAQCILSNRVKMKEYSTVLCPVAKVLEGYLKSLLVRLRLEKRINMKEGWNFSKVFTSKGIKSFNNGQITDKQGEELTKLYDLVKEFRHDVNHGSLKPKLVIRDRLRCVEKYEEILERIKQSYFIIFE